MLNNYLLQSVQKRSIRTNFADERRMDRDYRRSILDKLLIAAHVLTTDTGWATVSSLIHAR